MQLNKPVPFSRNRNRLIASLMASVLEAKEFETAVAHSANEAKEAVVSFDPDLCLIDINLGEGPNGFHFGDWLNLNHPDCVQLYLTSSTELRGWFDGKNSKPGLTGVNVISKRKLGDSEQLVLAIENAFQSTQIETRSLVPHEQFSKLSLSQIQVLGLADKKEINQRVMAVRHYLEAKGFAKNDQ